jgi:Carboxypeptidase regulatory-like domain
MRLKVAVTLLLLLLASVCLAQEITGTIVGTVKDPHGAVVPNATVTVTNTDKNVVVRTVNTDSNGAYAAPLLPIGHYSVAITADGFKKASQTGIELNVSDRLTQNFNLQVGGSEQEVTVEANPVQVELQSAQTAGLINGTQIRELSLNNRNYIQLVTLMPGVSSTMGDQPYVGTTNPLGSANTLGLSINGARTSANSWTVDGADNVDRGSNLTLLTTPSIDSIAEFKVLRSNYNPEYGRAAAGQVNVITRSGTDTLHGTAYEFWRNENLNANDYFRKQSQLSNPASVGCDPTRFAGHVQDCDSRSPLRYHNFGYTVGGPVFIPHIYDGKKHKTFFFFSEEFRRVKSVANATATMPTLSELQGNFGNAVVCTAFSGSTCTATGSQITNINPISQAYVNQILSKVPLAPDASNRTIRNFFPSTSNFRQEIAKIDQSLGSRVNAFVRYEHDSIPTIEPQGLFGQTAVPFAGATETNSPGWTLSTRATATLSPNTLLEAGYNFSYGAIISRPVGLLSTADIPISLPFTTTSARVPAIAWASGTGGLSNVQTFGPYNDFNRNHQLFGNLSRIYSKHNLKFGGTYYHYQKKENAFAFQGNAATFTFAAGGVQPTTVPAGSVAASPAQQAIANFLLGSISSFSQASIDVTPDVRANQFEFYGQDEWRVRHNLTLTYGVRWSIFRQPTDASGLLTNFDPAFYDPAQAPQLDAKGALVPGTGNLLNGIVPSQAAMDNCQQLLSSGQVPVCWPTGTKPLYGNKVGNEDNRAIAPRLGLAWDPWGDGKTSFRAGYGLFYDSSLVGVIEQNEIANFPFVNNLQLNNVTYSALSGALALPTVPKAVGSRVDPNIKTPYIQNWSFGLQHELPHSVIFEVTYVGTKGTHLIGIEELNQPAVGAYQALGISPATGVTSSTTPLLNSLRPFVGYDAIPAIRSAFDSNYNSLQTSVEKRFHGNSQLGLAYTWSHSLTDNQTDRSTAPRLTSDPGLDYGPTQQDRRHVLTANFVYDMPFFRAQQGVVGHVLGGWEITGITSIATGVPFTVTDNKSGRDQAGTGCLDPNTPCSVFPDVDPSLLYTSQVKDPNTGKWQWFNPAAFTSVPTGQVRPGDARRGAVYGPGFWRQDISLFKNIRFTERLGGQFRAEAFNVFNHTNPLTIGTSMAAGTFGQVTAVRDPRIMQLGFKLNF